MPESNKGLAGVVAGETAVCTVGAGGDGLHYRGYDVTALTQQTSFEEVAYLLISGDLPTHHQLEQRQAQFQEAKKIPDSIKVTLELMPSTAHPMDVLRTACSILGTIEPETNHEQQINIAYRLMPFLASCLFYWFHFHYKNKKINENNQEDTLAGHVLQLLNQTEPAAKHLKALQVSMILYAEHEFNASTFAARVCVATGADFYGPITAAIATLRGALHGGANEAAMALIQQYDNPDTAEQGILQKLRDKEVIMGFGHRVYKIQDPRSSIIKNIAESLIEDDYDNNLFTVASRIEQIMWQEKKLFPNLDFFSALVYHKLGFNTELFTPLFVLARLAGWAAHVIEQRANNRLIRPTASYIGPEPRDFQTIENR